MQEAKARGGEAWKAGDVDEAIIWFSKVTVEEKEGKFSHGADRTTSETFACRLASCMYFPTGRVYVVPGVFVSMVDTFQANRRTRGERLRYT